MKSMNCKFTLAAALVAVLLGWAVAGGVFTTRPAHAENGYTNLSLKGTFGFTIQGVAGGPIVSGYGLLAADGNGGVTGTETLQLPGGMLRRSFQGSYVVNPDGTGTMTLNFAQPPDVGRDGPDEETQAPSPAVVPSSHFAFVLVDGSKELRSIQTDSGAIVSAAFKLQ